MVAKSKRILARTGAVIAIPLPNGMYAYGKLFHDPYLGIYECLSPSIRPCDEVIKHPVSFFNAINNQAIRTGDWPIIGEEPFLSEEESWPPPQATMYSRETNRWTMGGIPRVSYRGETLSATIEDVQGLDIATANPRPEGVIRMIIDRLVNGNHDNYKVRPQ